MPTISPFGSCKNTRIDRKRAGCSEKREERRGLGVSLAYASCTVTVLVRRIWERFPSFRCGGAPLTSEEQHTQQDLRVNLQSEMLEEKDYVDRTMRLSFEPKHCGWIRVADFVANVFVATDVHHHATRLRLVHLQQGVADR